MTNNLDPNNLEHDSPVSLSATMRIYTRAVHGYGITNLWKLDVQSRNPRGPLDQCASATHETPTPVPVALARRECGEFRPEKSAKLTLLFDAHTGKD